MNIGLIDVDSHNFPNLALMKISAHHKAMGDTVEFADIFGKYDIVYKSKVFSYTYDDEYAFDCDKYIAGGSGYNYQTLLPEVINSKCPDYSLYNCQHAYGFLTRGCIRNCPWCIVPKKEGKIRPESDIHDFIADKRSIILMDNNVLACEHGIKQIEKIIKYGYKVDFNQGLDARLIDDSIAKLLAKVKWIRYIRFACDIKSQMKSIENAVNSIRKHSGKIGEFFCYMLVKDDLKDAEERAIFLRNLNINAFAQAYRDFDNNKPERKINEFCRWVNIKPFFKTKTFKEWLQYRKFKNP